MRWTTVISVLLFFSSCSPTPFFEKEVIVPNSMWTYDNKPSFNVGITNTNQNYDLFLVIDHSFEFSYQNLYLKITTGFPPSNKKEVEDKTEQLSIDLANTKGEWIGDCSSSDCVAKVYLLENFKFAEAGEYTFTLEQFSRDNNLNGINKLNLQIFEANSKADN